MRWIAILASAALAACTSSTTLPEKPAAGAEQLSARAAPLIHSAEVGRALPLASTALPPLPWELERELEGELEGQQPAQTDLQPLAPELLAVSAEMKAFVDSIDPSLSPNQRMRRILRTLRQQRFYMDYDLDTTATAAEAFSQRRGNCISFAAMIVALAREVGVPAHFNQVHAPKERRATRSDSGRVLVENILHINAEISYGWSTRIVEMNFEPRSHYRHAELSDEEVQVLYLNNLALGAARDGDFSTAIGIAREALTLSPESSVVWNTLGYLYRRQGSLELAELSYTRAIALDDTNISAKRNLQRVYQLQSRRELLQAAESSLNANQDS
uniref:transglutaminase domain-containing protein n=1 Tax=Microbulbifer agarilyticus TaxID=260552 RepID=UPI00025586FD|nr:transglutaminase domain-containing protein [Microbulbifer agarilyticus]